MYLRMIFERGDYKNGDKSPKLSTLLKPATESGETITVTPFHASRAFRDALRMRASGRGCQHKKTPEKYSGETDWWRRWGSNPRPQACKARALPTELRPLLVINAPAATRLTLGRLFAKKVVGPTRFELVTSRLSAGRSDQLSYGPTCGASFTSRLAIISQPNAVGQQKFKNL